MNGPIIDAVDLCKTYRILEGKRGFTGALRNLVSRQYKEIHAVRNLNLSVEAGSVVGMIGPNGAGKSTTIKLLTGIIVPNSGNVRVLDIDPSVDRTTNAMNIAVVFGQRTKLWWDLPCMESFELHRSMYRIDRASYEERINEFTRILGIDEFWKSPVRQLSLGQRMRAELSLSMLHDPSVVFLDEPSIGLDAIAKERVRQFILERNEKRQTTFIITSHDMADIERLCSRVVIIDRGAIVYDGTMDGIKQQYGSDRTLTVEFRDEPSHIDLPFGQIADDKGVVKSIRFSRAEGSSIDLINHLAAISEIVDVSMSDAEIESVIRTIYEGRGN